MASEAAETNHVNKCPVCGSELAEPVLYFAGSSIFLGSRRLTYSLKSRSGLRGPALIMKLLQRNMGIPIPLSRLISELKRLAIRDPEERKFAEKAVHVHISRARAILRENNVPLEIITTCFRPAEYMMVRRDRRAS